MLLWDLWNLKSLLCSWYNCSYSDCYIEHKIVNNCFLFLRPPGPVLSSIAVLLVQHVQPLLLQPPGWRASSAGLPSAGPWKAGCSAHWSALWWPRGSSCSHGEKDLGHLERRQQRQVVLAGKTRTHPRARHYQWHYGHKCDQHTVLLQLLRLKLPWQSQIVTILYSNIISRWEMWLIFFSWFWALHTYR